MEYWAIRVRHLQRFSCNSHICSCHPTGKHVYVVLYGYFKCVLAKSNFDGEPGANEREISNLFIRTGRIQYIVMSFILSAFIVFGKQFIYLWAGEGYEDAYYLSLMFFVPLTIPLIQNLGISILQARNQMKFRSLLYIVIALASLGLSILLAKQ